MTKTTSRLPVELLCAIALTLVACAGSDRGGSAGKSAAGSGGRSSDIGAGASGRAGAGGNRAGAGRDAGGIAGAGSAPDSGPSENQTEVGPDGLVPKSIGVVDSDAHADLGLPALPSMIDVTATTIGDSVSIAFHPFDGAADYRVYELPAKENISVTGDQVTIQGAVYRCAGQRQAPAATLDGAKQVQSGAIRTLVDGQNVDGHTRSLADATLGYVYPSPGPGRVPVYALGDGDAEADNECYFQRWSASRVKRYVTSADERRALLAKGSRDDGIAFYAPDKAGSDTREVLTSAQEGAARYYFTQGPEASKRDDPKPAFLALTRQAEGSLPLLRVFYQNACGRSHDELVSGRARFELVRRQGDRQPVSKLHWSGLSKQTTLVVEALDAGCPFQALLAPKASPAYTDKNFGVEYQPWVTPEDAQKSAPARELFINGQFDGTKPRPIARSFVKVSPAPAPELDWSFGFSAADSMGNFKTVECGAPDKNCWGQHRLITDSVAADYFNVEPERFAHRLIFGEWWVMYSDIAADTTGKYRLTPTPKANLSAETFLYVSMDVNSFTTLRRYPQILISDRDSPVQYDLENGNTLIIQTFGDWPNAYEVQVCDHRNWDVNDQCPRYDLYRQRDPSNAQKIVGLAPNVEIGDQIGMDYSNRYEIFVSTRRAYLFFDGQPYGCVDLPVAGVPQGAVTVTFGDVLYHSGVDQLFTFTTRRLQNDTQRHFDNLGFKSGVGAPPWDAARFPCTRQLAD